MFDQGAIYVNEARCSDPQTVLESGQAYILKIGKRRFYKAIIS